MELFERVSNLAEKKAGSRTKLAKILNIGQVTFNGYFKVERQNNLWPILFKILKIYPEISRDWLFFGEGEMIKSNQPAESTDSRTIEKLKSEIVALKDELLESQRREISLLMELKKGVPNISAVQDALGEESEKDIDIELIEQEIAEGVTESKIPRYQLSPKDKLGLRYKSLLDLQIPGFKIGPETLHITFCFPEHLNEKFLEVLEEYMVGREFYEEDLLKALSVAAGEQVLLVRLQSPFEEKKLALAAPESVMMKSNPWELIYSAHSGPQTNKADDEQPQAIEQPWPEERDVKTFIPVEAHRQSLELEEG